MDSLVFSVLHPVAGALDDDGLGVVQEPIQNGGGNGAVVVEDRRPLFEGLVGRQHDGTALVALADDLEEQVGAVLVDRQVANLVQDQEFGPQIGFELAFEQAALVSGREMLMTLMALAKRTEAPC